MPTIHRLNLHDGQKAIVNSNARYRVASCGRRFGKTMLAGYWLALRDCGKSAASGGRTARKKRTGKKKDSHLVSKSPTIVYAFSSSRGVAP